MAKKEDTLTHAHAHNYFANRHFQQAEIDDRKINMRNEMCC